mgnify:CR=1 FL=1
MWARCGLGSKYVVLYLHTAKTLKTYVCTISISTFLLPHFLSDIYTGLVELGGGGGGKKTPPPPKKMASCHTVCPRNSPILCNLLHTVCPRSSDTF